jgi:hypothetical protein
VGVSPRRLPWGLADADVVIFPLSLAALDTHELITKIRSSSSKSSNKDSDGGPDALSRSRSIFL